MAGLSAEDKILKNWLERLALPKKMEARVLELEVLSFFFFKFKYFLNVNCFQTSCFYKKIKNSKN